MKEKYDKKNIAIEDLKKTFFLNTAIIEKEWIIRLKSDILEGPKYLKPRIELIEFKLGICFFSDPEKLLHKLSLVDKIFISFFVKQLKFPKEFDQPILWSDLS